MATKTPKITKSFRVSQKVIDTICAYKDEHGLTETAALEQLVLRGARATNDNETAFLEKMDAFFNSWKTGVLLSCRQTERYSFMLIEMLNSLISAATDENTDVYFSTLRLEAERAKKNKNLERFAEIKETAGTAMYRGAVKETQDFFGYVKQVKDNQSDGEK